MKRLILAALVCLSFNLAGHAEDSKAPTSAPAPVAEVQADGSLLLKPEGARIHGFHLKLETKPTPTLVFWISDNEYPEWPQAVDKKGTYAVEVTYSCPERAGGDYSVEAAANRINSHTERTADWQTFKTVKLGNLTVLNDHTSVALRARGHIEHALMNVQSVKLTPVKEEKK
jgi:hypothetical protein